MLEVGGRGGSLKKQNIYIYIWYVVYGTWYMVYGMWPAHIYQTIPRGYPKSEIPFETPCKIRRAIG